MFHEVYYDMLHDNGVCFSGFRTGVLILKLAGRDPQFARVKNSASRRLASVTFYTRPGAIDCRKSSVVARLGTVICGVSNIASNIRSLYVNAEGDSQCAITMN